MEGSSSSDVSKGKLKRNEAPRDEREGSSDRNGTHVARQPRAIPSGLALPTTKAARLSNPLARRILPWWRHGRARGPRRASHASALEFSVYTYLYNCRYNVRKLE